jgi:fructokinase
MKRVCVFGEVLYDHFPDGSRVLGGAPFNVAWHLQAFGQSPAFISRVGDDAEGAAIREAMQAWGMDTGSLEIDSEHPTGRVDVELVDGEPSYDIVRPCAWDAIEAGQAGAGCGILYHGSLASREPASREALARVKRHSPGIVFVDVNLRSPWWTRDRVLSLMESAHWVKLNHEELALLLPTDTPDTESARAFIEEHGLQGVVLTHGGSGAEILAADGAHAAVTPEPAIEIVDTVGAGDAFASVIILGLASDWPLETMLARAQSFASRIVGQRGATVSDSGFYRPFIESWNLDKH